MINKPSDAVLSDITVDEITDYLKSTGWKQTNYENKKLLLFCESVDEAEALSLVIPSERSVGDYARRLREAIDLLAQVLNTEPQNVVESIKNPFVDVVKLRIKRKEALLPFNYAVSIMEDLRDLLMYSASAEKIIHPAIRKLTNEAFDFVEGCKLGHTFPGSFGFTIESYIYDTPPLQGFEIHKPIPFQRQVLSRIATGLDTVKEAALVGDPDIIVQSYKSGMVANMCDAVFDMFSVLKTPTLEYSFQWSQKWVEPLSDRGPITTIELTPSVVPFLKVASERLSKQESEAEDTDVVGHIVELKFKVSDDDPDNPEHARQVKIYGRDKSKRWKNVIAHLTPTDYLLACRAHPEGQLVQISGQIEKGAKHWYLRRPRDFKIFEDDQI